MKYSYLLLLTLFLSACNTMPTKEKPTKKPPVKTVVTNEIYGTIFKIAPQSGMKVIADNIVVEVINGVDGPCFGNTIRLTRTNEKGEYSFKKLPFSKTLQIAVNGFNGGDKHNNPQHKGNCDPKRTYVFMTGSSYKHDIQLDPTSIKPPK